MRLGELLVGEKLVSVAGIEEALEAQVVHGGRLGTNLLELGLVQEKDLARVLGKQHGVAFASGEMKPDPAALALIDPELADAKEILAMRLEPTRLSVAMINPHDLETLDALAFKTGKRVLPVVVPEFRMNQLLRRFCKAFRPIRAVDMHSVRPSRTLTAKAGPAAKTADLISEDEFQTLYDKALIGGTAEEEVLEGELVETGEFTIPAEAPSRAIPPGPILASPPVAAALPPVEAARPPPPTPPAPRPPPVVPPAVTTPLTFPQAQALLGTSSNREDIAQTVLRFARGKWKRALLLSVQGDLVTGWRGLGEGVREAAVPRIGVALRGQSTFKLVRDTRSHYIGPMKRDAGTMVFYKLLGGDFPTTAVLLPLLVRGKVVHILYVDNGPGQITPPDIGELLILSQSVARSYETLIKRRKSG